jgi:hypothetical protein
MHASYIPTAHLPAIVRYHVPVPQNALFPEKHGTELRSEFTQVGAVTCPSCSRQNLSWNMECTWCGHSVDPTSQA